MLMMCLLVWACDDVENSIYRGHSCYFIFDAARHPAPCQLTVALGNPGHFLTVRAKMVNGARHILTTRNYDQAEEDITLTIVIRTSASYTDSPNPDDDEPPKTGDTTELTFLFVLMIGSAAGLAVLLMPRKKREARDE